MNPGYPPNWNEIAQRVKDEAGGLCEYCNHPNDKPSGHVLTVHHLDGDPSNNKRSNLRALCQRCHLKAAGYLLKYGLPPKETLFPNYHARTGNTLITQLATFS